MSPTKTQTEESVYCDMVDQYRSSSKEISITTPNLSAAQSFGSALNITFSGTSLTSPKEDLQTVVSKTFIHSQEYLCPCGEKNCTACQKKDDEFDSVQSKQFVNSRSEESKVLASFKTESESSVYSSDETDDCGYRCERKNAQILRRVSREQSSTNQEVKQSSSSREQCPYSEDTQQISCKWIPIQANEPDEKQSRTTQLTVNSLPMASQSISNPESPGRPTSADEKIIPLLESIYEVLQIIRDEQLNTKPAPRPQNVEPPKQDEIEDYIDLQPPPPPPPSPSITHQIHISSMPPCNIYITPVMPAYDHYDVGIEPQSQSSNSRICETELFHSAPEFIDGNEGMALLEPPVRDVDIQGDRRSEERNQRLIPVDMDLLRTVDDFDWQPRSEQDPGISTANECYLDWSESQRIPRVSKEIQVGGEDFAVCQVECIEREIQVESDLFLSTEKASKARFLQFDEDTEEKESEDELKVSSSGNHKYSLDSVSNELLTCVDNYTQPTLNEKSEEKESLCECEIPHKENMECVCAPHLECENSETTNDSLTDLEVSISDDTNARENITPRILSIEDMPPAEVETQCSLVFTPATSDRGTDRPEFDDTDRNYGNLSQRSCCCSICGRWPSKCLPPTEMNNFIDSIICDLKVIKEYRRNASRRQYFAKECQPGKSIELDQHDGDLSYPVAIKKVQPLGTNSLFVKWKIFSASNVAGYEVFLDEQMTNRYFSCIHRAAVICHVDLQVPHKIILRAIPHLLTSSTPSLSSNNPEASFRQPDGSVWFPSVFHYHPKCYSVVIDNDENRANNC